MGRLMPAKAIIIVPSCQTHFDKQHKRSSGFEVSRRRCRTAFGFEPPAHRAEKWLRFSASNDAPLETKEHRMDPKSDVHFWGRCSRHGRCSERLSGPAASGTASRPDPRSVAWRSRTAPSQTHPRPTACRLEERSGTGAPINRRAVGSRIPGKQLWRLQIDRERDLTKPIVEADTPRPSWPSAPKWDRLPEPGNACGRNAQPARP
jgi:hypothetical protein